MWLLQKPPCRSAAPLTFPSLFPAPEVALLSSLRTVSSLGRVSALGYQALPSWASKTGLRGWHIWIRLAPDAPGGEGEKERPAGGGRGGNSGLLRAGRRRRRRKGCQGGREGVGGQAPSTWQPSSGALVCSHSPAFKAGVASQGCFYVHNKAARPFAFICIITISRQAPRIVCAWHLLLPFLSLATRLDSQIRQERVGGHREGLSPARQPKTEAPVFRGSCRGGEWGRGGRVPPMHPPVSPSHPSCSRHSPLIPNEFNEGRGNDFRVPPHGL